MQKSKLKKKVKIWMCRLLLIGSRVTGTVYCSPKSAFLLLGHTTGLHSPTSLAVWFSAKGMWTEVVCAICGHGPWNPSFAFFHTLSSFHLTGKNRTVVTLEALFWGWQGLSHPRSFNAYVGERGLANPHTCPGLSPEPRHEIWLSSIHQSVFVTSA